MGRKTKFTIIHVTDDDFRKAEQADPFTCNPMTLAIQRQVKRTMYFGWEYVHNYSFVRDGSRYHQRQSIRVQRAMDKFRSGKPIKPFSFVLYHQAQQTPWS